MESVPYVPWTAQLHREVFVEYAKAGGDPGVIAPNVVVASWSAIKLYRRLFIETSSIPIVSSWKHAAKTTELFVSKGRSLCGDGGSDASHEVRRSDGYRVYVLAVSSFLRCAILCTTGCDVPKEAGVALFGYSFSDNITIMMNWEKIQPDFRFFSSLHHVLALAMAATWALIDGVWCDYVVIHVCGG